MITIDDNELWSPATEAQEDKNIVTGPLILTAFKGPFVKKNIYIKKF
jgi:hypothetical protein